MAKSAHHHPMSPGMSKAQDWFGKIVILAATIGGVVVLFSALTSHGSSY
ncbi:MAG: hypothetical protein WDN45_00870 [Caulobacteraceae bacterium]